MKKVDIYSNAPAEIARELAASVPVADFLPSPEEFAKALRREETVPVTMKLKKRTVDRYRRFAKTNGIRYQTFISSLLDTYAVRLKV